MGLKLYVKDNGAGGRVHEYGTDPHDSLKIQKDGSLQYYNLQDGEGAGEYGDYEFCFKDGSTPDDDEADERILDIGGDRTGIDCWRCLYRDATKVCIACMRNTFSHSDDFKEDEEFATEQFKKLIQ